MRAFFFSESGAHHRISRHTGNSVTTRILIRPVAADDFGAWKQLWDGYNAFYARAGPTALPLEITKMTWSRFFDAYEPVHAMVAESKCNGDAAI
jgi:hypothetical protein